MSHRPSRKLYLATFLGPAFFATALQAGAVALWWVKTPVHTSSHNACISFADTAMRSLNFQNIRRSPDEVAGTTGGVYTAVTCVATNPAAIAIIMVAGNDQAEATRVAGTVRQKIAGIVSFDP